MALTRPPDIVLADLGRFLAVRSPEGAYWSAADHGEQIQASFLREETGLDVLPWPSGDRGEALDCTDALCRYSARGRIVAIVTGAAALPLDCGSFDAIVSQVPAGFRCRSVMPVVDRIDSWRLGAVALWLGERDITIDSANGSRGDRPWVPHPHSRHRVQPSSTGGGS
jgi:competence protein ComEC